MPWATLTLLGAYHGVNPGMGWLFAVALGFQEGRREGVLRALPPIALGHEASVAVVALVVSGAQIVADPRPIQVAGALGLIAFGVFKLVRPRWHPRWRAMRVNGRDLVLWSFLMSSAHGAGAMLLPVLLGMPGSSHEHAAGTAEHFHGQLSTISLHAGTAVLVHSLAMLVVMATVALVVYERVGLSILRRAWVNLDLLWSIAIITAGVFTLFT